MLYTTLKHLRKANACAEGMQTLKASLPSDVKDTFRISLKHILESNGLDHAIWAMQATTVNCKKEIALLACDFAKTSIANYVTVYPSDTRPQEAIQAAEDFIVKKITLDVLNTKLAAAESAAWSAESAARSAAESAAWSAQSAAQSAARSAWSAARSAAWSAESAARSAESAARSAESAAWSAQSAAQSAARSAARSAWSAAWSAAQSAANEKNKQIFLLRIS